MHARSPKLLEDIRDAAAFIGEVTQNRTLAQYSAARLLRRGVERNFEIIGEAVKRLAQVDPDSAARIAQYPQIIAFRNILIHGYDLVDRALVWSTVQTQLPTLLRREAGETVGNAPGGRVVHQLISISSSSDSSALRRTSLSAGVCACARAA